MCVWSQGFTSTQKLKFPPLLHASCIQPHYVEMFLRVLCPVKTVTTLICILLNDSSLVLTVEQGPEINFQTCLWVQVRPLHIAIYWLSFQHYVFFFCHETPQGWFQSSKLVNSSLPCAFIGSFISVSPKMSGDPKWSHRILGGNVIQCLLALLYKAGCCFGSWTCFQNSLTEQILTFLWSNVPMNFICTGHDSTYSFENCTICS